MNNIRFELHAIEWASGQTWEVVMVATINTHAGELTLRHSVHECDTRRQAAAMANKLDKIFNG